MSAKNRDRHNRFRSITVGFRVSPEEQEQLNRAVALSGLLLLSFPIRLYLIFCFRLLVFAHLLRERCLRQLGYRRIPVYIAALH